MTEGLDNNMFRFFDFICHIRMYYFPRPNVWGVSTSRSPGARAWLLHVKFRESSLENKYTARTDSRVLSPRRRRDISRC